MIFKELPASLEMIFGKLQASLEMLAKKPALQLRLRNGNGTPA
jgi:hypothetical protein